MKHSIRILSRALSLALLCIAGSASAQLSSMGRDFYFAYTRTSFDCTTVRPYQSYWILISSPYDCNATVSYFDELTGGEITDKTVHVVAKNYQQIPVNTTYTEYTDQVTGGRLDVDGEKPLYTAIHVHADHPIAVSYFSTGPDNGAMYMALPTQALGKKYVVAAAPNNDGTGAPSPARFCNNGGEPSSSFFSVIAIKDGTHVTIRPSGTTRHAFPGASSGPNNGNGAPSDLTVTLQRGQVFRVLSWIKTNPAPGELDMTGSQIEADQPIAVISGCENALNRSGADFQDDQRNLTCQMMVPVDFWASQDYLTASLLDAPGLSSTDSSYGDQIKLVVADRPSAGCQIVESNSSSAVNLQVTPYQFPAATINNVVGGSRFSSQCGQKFMVEQYDYRARGNTYPFTAPTQMNVVPKQNFANRYLWTVPNAVRMVKSHFYVNVICRSDQASKIKVFKNGLPVGTLSNIGAITGSATIPGFPELIARTYEVAVGCYYATADSAFAVYEYGMSGFDNDADLGDFDGDDYFNEFASPVGQTFHIDGAGRPTAAVDTLCNGAPYWIVHVRDTAAIDRFISAVDILKDPLGIIKQRPGTDSGYTSYNVDFNPVGFTVMPGTNTKVDIPIVVQNPLKNAEAWVWAVNGAGNDTVMHLVYIAPNIQFGAITSKGVDASGNARLDFRNAALGVDTCSWFVLKNATAAGGLIYNLKTIRFQNGGDGVFTASPMDAAGHPVALPASLAPGDSVIIRVCFDPSQKATAYADTLYAETDCPFAVGYVTGYTSMPEITATDYDFGAVPLGRTKCHTVRVTNTGKAPFTLTNQWVLTNYVQPDFTFSDASKLPAVLLPDSAINLNFCFTPTNDTIADSTVVVWGTNIPNDYKAIKKNYSILKGAGIEPQLHWNPDDTTLLTLCNTPDTFRTYLLNTGTAPIVVGEIRLTPTMLKDTAWKILGTSLNRTTNIVINNGDSIWVDVSCTPSPVFNCVSSASLVAFDADSIQPSERINVIGRSSVTASQQIITNVIVAPNPLQSEFVVSVSLERASDVSVEVFDVLGNRITTEQLHASQTSDFPIDANAWQAGTYFVRVATAGGTITKRIIKR